MLILLVRQKGFNREGPDDRIEIEEDFRIVKWSSKFIEIKLFRILQFITRSDLKSSSLFTRPSNTVDGFTEQLEGVVRSILDDHAPLKTRTKIPGKTVNRHLPPNVVTDKKRRRQLERRWKNTKSESDRVAYRTACHKTNTKSESDRVAYLAACRKTNTKSESDRVAYMAACRKTNTKSESDRVAYMADCRKTNTLITNSLRNYFAGKNK